MFKKLLFALVFILVGWKLAENIFGHTPSNIKNISDIKMLEYEKSIGEKDALPPDIYEISYIKNLRQTPRNGAIYNLIAIVEILTKKSLTENDVVSQMGKWQIPGKGYAPFTLRNNLQYYGIEPQEVNLRFATNEQKLLYLQSQLAQGTPIILLVRTEDRQHYITLLGYNFTDRKNKQFFVYDPLIESTVRNPQLTIDTNGSLTGNQTLTAEALIDYWEKGGVFGLYKWYGIVMDKTS